ncbi:MULTISPECIES: FliI/YscN family ATPase [unclassified Aliiroseovarius]|uniref:FliI/YscN family ATPase n=1 Tax=unclassified Aliiroseovarius TaxID=2623558 RepID=UPI001568C98F|nr:MULTISPECIES: FliI/YscN family ATPase [unclassified Aliiroseovarius]NRP13137.1 Flagellum-specific ATP synthase [Aliiroseovarius sp. xm-d-517]NRP40388.1 Flagellum-specific ATP synthase [Aliiroseovarius sp. xm-m-339-2]NRP61394.1 Flagellum-specific ATP synthase [Aliiroseovarius sp. xm-a-151]
MKAVGFEQLTAEVAAVTRTADIGRIVEIHRGTIEVAGLSHVAAQSDLVEIGSSGQKRLGEVLNLSADRITVLPDGDVEGLRIGEQVVLRGGTQIAPDDSWIGRVLDPFGKAIDGFPVMRGGAERPLRGTAINPTRRRVLGARLETGLAVFNTLLPIVKGQRIGLFAGSGVGKSTLLAKLARGVQADVVVIALIGERGREVREFVERVLGSEGMKRAVVIAATSDQSPMVRRRAGWAAMSVAEHFRDQGRHVLFLADSVTRFAEAHREIALASGEGSSLRGFPPSTAQQITTLCERAGPGQDEQGDITAIFSVLVAGSDMEEPVADILRGVLDGHVVLDRQIAERGRFPAIDLLRSVSRALPGAATDAENALISAARQRLGAYARSEMMIQAGLYAAGSDPMVDAAIECYPKLDGFLAEDELESTEASFRRLGACMTNPS